MTLSFLEAHEDFKVRLSKSEIGVAIIRHWLEMEGIQAEQEVVTLPDSPGYNPSKKGDIRAVFTDGSKGTVEVKHRKKAFTKMWPYDTTWLIREAEYERKMRTEYPITHFVILSIDYSHAAIFSGSREEMFIQMDFDKKRGTRVPKLSVKSTQLRYFKVPDEAIQRVLGG